MSTQQTIELKTACEPSEFDLSEGILINIDRVHLDWVIRYSDCPERSHRSIRLHGLVGFPSRLKDTFVEINLTDIESQVNVTMETDSGKENGIGTWRVLYGGLSEFESQAEKKRLWFAARIFLRTGEVNDILEVVNALRRESNDTLTVSAEVFGLSEDARYILTEPTLVCSSISLTLHKATADVPVTVTGEEM